MAEGHLTFTGSGNNYFSTTDSANLSIAGDCTIVAKVRFAAMSGIRQTIIAKRDGSGDEWQFRLGTSGALEWLFWDSTVVTVITSDALLSSFVGTDQNVWIKMEFDADNGAAGNDTTFSYNNTYTGASEPSSWTQLGSTITDAGAATIDSNLSNAVLLGLNIDSGTHIMNGRIYYVRLDNAGTTVANPDMRFTNRHGDWSGTPVTDDHSNSWARTGSLTYTANNFGDPVISNATPPSQITGLAEWWNPDDLSGSSFDDITTWGGFRNLSLTGSATSGDKPEILETNRQPTAVNHQTVLISDGGNGQRLSATSSRLDNANVTYAMIYWPPGFAHSGANGPYVFTKNNTNAATVGLRYTTGTSGGYEVVYRLDGSEGTLRTLDASAYNQQAKPHLIVITYDGTDMALRINGTEVATQTQAGNIDTDNSAALVIGNHPSSDYAHSGMYGDIAVYSVALSGADLTNLEAWFTERWQLDTYWDEWVTIPATIEASPGAGESDVRSPSIHELDADTWIMFGVVRETATGDDRWIDYWTSPKSDPHNWTRNPGGVIIDATTDSPPDCRSVTAIKDGSTWHILVDAVTGADGWYHFTGTDLAALTDNGLVFTGQGAGWEEFVRHPHICTEKVGASWAIYYDGRETTATSGVGSIGRTLTTDFSTFTNRTEVMDKSNLWWEDTDVGAPAVRYANKQWQMLYAGYSDGSSAYGSTGSPHWIGLATSPDGLTWTKLAAQVPLITMVRDGQMDDRLNAPEWFHDGDDLYIYFANVSPGNDIMSTKVKAATLDAISSSANAGRELLLLGVPL